MTGEPGDATKGLHSAADGGLQEEAADAGSEWPSWSEALARVSNPFGGAVSLLERCGSTMDVARELVVADAERAHGTVLVALEQTQGRGRHGRSWSSSPAASLTFSLPLCLSFPAERTPLLPFAMGGKVVEGFRGSLGLDLRLKWPNDIVCPQGRKLAGILVEAIRLAPERVELVVGVGLNVAQSPASFPPELREIATSLALLDAPTTSLPEVLELVLSGCHEGVQLVTELRDDELRTLWDRTALERDREVVVQTPDQEIRGIVRALSPREGLLIDTGASTPITVRGEHVTQLRVV